MASSVFLWAGIAPGGNFSGQMVGAAADNTAAPPFTFSGDLTSGYASSAVGTLSLVTAGTTRLSINSTGATFASGVVGSFTNNALATTSTAGLTLNNATPATALATVQISPRFELAGTAWNSSGGGSSEVDKFFFENLPATVAGATTGTLKFGWKNAAVAATYPMTLTSAGALTTLGVISSPASDGYRLGSTDTFYASGAELFVGGNSAYTTITRGGGGALVKARTNGPSGGYFNDVNILTEVTTIAAAATTTTTIQMPAAAVVLGVSVRVTTVIPTATSFSVGDSGSATRFSTANVSTAANSTDPGTKAGAYYNASATGILLTMNGGTPADNTGRVRVTIYYYSVTPPTS